MNNLPLFMRYISIALLLTVGCRYLVDLIWSYMNYNILIKSSKDRGKVYLPYGCLPGNSTGNYSFIEFTNKFGAMKLDVCHFKGEFYNSLQRTHVSSKWICIDDEMIIPNTYLDYVRIINYLMDKILIPHNITTKKIDDTFYRSFYRFSYNLYKSKYFNEGIKDIVSVRALPSRYNTPFIYYDVKTKTAFCYKININLMIQLIILSCAKTLDPMNNKFIDSDNYDKIISDDIYNYIKTNNVPYIDTYQIVASDNIIPEVLSYMITGLDNDIDGVKGDPKLMRILRNWKSNNYAKSFWKSLPITIEIEYDEMFGEDIKAINKACK